MLLHILYANNKLKCTTTISAYPFNWTDIFLAIFYLSISLIFIYAANRTLLSTSLILQAFFLLNSAQVYEKSTQD